MLTLGWVVRVMEWRNETGTAILRRAGWLRLKGCFRLKAAWLGLGFRVEWDFDVPQSVYTSCAGVECGEGFQICFKIHMRRTWHQAGHFWCQAQNFTCVKGVHRWLACGPSSAGCPHYKKSDP